MVSHVVLLRLRDSLTRRDREGFVEAFRTAITEIPTVRGVRIGRRLTFGAAYEPAAPDLTYCAILDFDDLEGLGTYLAHPAHAELGTRFGELTDRALVFDYAMTGLEGLAVLADD